MTDCSTTTCCWGTPEGPRAPSDVRNQSWFDGWTDGPTGPVPRVKTTLTLGDHLASWRVRWGFRRMDYRVEPGLHTVGNPTETAPVLVTANYKLSFDHLRSAVAGRDAWILVLDSRGVNVWCAAGKGTFGTDELCHQVAEADLERVVTHRQLVVPQLGAPGIRAHEVRAATGFRVVFGPVRARDLPAFLDAGLKADPAMRTVDFPLRDRLVLVPIELVTSWKYVLAAAVLLAVLSGLGDGGYSLDRVGSAGLANAAVLLGAWLAGLFLIPALLPWLPGRAFSIKGVWVGLLYATAAGLIVFGIAESEPSRIVIAAWLVFIPAATSFLGMNFTGASTFTSLSGVLKEMRMALPFQVAGAVAGIALWITALFL